MKIAVSGKGGVGKSTVAAALALLLVKKGKRVLTVDADADANLASALGATDSELKKIIPISRQIALIEERTGAKVKQYGQIFNLNPDVSDIADKYASYIKGVALLEIGAIEKGGSGCACPESTLLRALITDLILYKDDILIMDMEAGIEHLGRATAKGVDLMLIVVEPGQRSLDSAYRITEMSHDIGLKDIKLVANKVRDKEDEKMLFNAFSESDYLGVIPYSEEIRQGDRTGVSVLENISDDIYKKFESVLTNIENQIQNKH
jgi:CO dehydrogenase maturation factor